MAGHSENRVLITGLAGFTGRHVADLLSRYNWDVVGLSNTDDAIGYPLFKCDLQDLDGLKSAIASIQPSHILHLAALSHVIGDPASFYHVNVVGTENLLEAIGASGANVKKMVIASSANIYGQTANLPISEDEPPRPVNHYAISKLAMEHVARQWFGRIPIILARPFNYTGSGQSENFVYAKLAGAFARRDPEIRLGNSEIARDLSDVRFVAEAYARLLQSEFASDVVNICSGKSLSISDAIFTLERLTGHTPKLVHDPSLVRKNDIVELYGDPAKLQRIIGPLRSFEPEEIFASMLDVQHMQTP